MLITWKDYITVAEGNGGTASITGTDIKVDQVIDSLASGKEIDEIVRELEGISYEHIFACLEYNRQRN